MASADDESDENNGNMESFFSSETEKILLPIHQSLEVTVTDNARSYSDRVGAVLSAWEKLAALASRACPDALLRLAQHIYRRTLEVILPGEWPHLPPAVKTHLSVTVQRCAAVAVRPTAVRLCRHLGSLVNDPWAHPTLRCLLDGRTVAAGALLQFCCLETAALLVLRLQTLCQSRCEDMALKVVRQCVRCQGLEDKSFHDICSEAQRLYFFDLCVALLFKYKQRDDIIVMLKPTDGGFGVALVRRFVMRCDSKERVWKNSRKLALFLSQVLLVQALVYTVTDDVHDLTVEWARLMHGEPGELESAVNKLGCRTESAPHVMEFERGVTLVFGSRLRPTAIELCVRALMLETNRLEHLKLLDDESADEQAVCRRTLAAGFMRLAELSADNARFSRECVLSAFSLAPSAGKLALLARLTTGADCVQSGGGAAARADAVVQALIRQFAGLNNARMGSGSAVADAGRPVPRGLESAEPPAGETVTRCGGEESQCCANHSSADRHQPCGACCSLSGRARTLSESDPTFVACADDLMDQLRARDQPLPERDIVEVLLRVKNKHADYDLLRGCGAALDALGVSEQLAADLMVVLSSTRWKMLSWSCDWGDLYPICQAYLQDPEGLVNTTKELKFLEIDYSQFMKKSVELDEFYGIEKGYERYLDMVSGEDELEPLSGLKGVSETKDKVVRSSIQAENDEISKTADKYIKSRPKKKHSKNKLKSNAVASKVKGGSKLKGGTLKPKVKSYARKKSYDKPTSKVVDLDSQDRPAPKTTDRQSLLKSVKTRREKEPSMKRVCVKTCKPLGVEGKRVTTTIKKESAKEKRSRGRSKKVTDSTVWSEKFEMLRRFMEERQQLARRTPPRIHEPPDTTAASPSSSTKQLRMFRPEPRSPDRSRPSCVSPDRPSTVPSALVESTIFYPKVRLNAELGCESTASGRASPRPVISGDQSKSHARRIVDRIQTQRDAEAQKRQLHSRMNLVKMSGVAALRRKLAAAVSRDEPALAAATSTIPSISLPSPTSSGPCPDENHLNSANVLEPKASLKNVRIRKKDFSRAPSLKKVRISRPKMSMWDTPITLSPMAEEVKGTPAASSDTGFDFGLVSVFSPVVPPQEHLVYPVHSTPPTVPSGPQPPRRPRNNRTNSGGAGGNSSSSSSNNNNNNNNNSSGLAGRSRVPSGGSRSKKARTDSAAADAVASGNPLQPGPSSGSSSSAGAAPADAPASSGRGVAPRSTIPYQEVLRKVQEEGVANERVPTQSGQVTSAGLSRLLHPLDGGSEQETITLYRSQDTSVSQTFIPSSSITPALVASGSSSAQATNSVVPAPTRPLVAAARATAVTRHPQVPEVKQVVIPPALQQAARLQQQQGQQQSQLSRLLNQRLESPTTSSSSGAQDAFSLLLASSRPQPPPPASSSPSSSGGASQLSEILSRPLDTSAPRQVKTRELASLLTAPASAAATSCRQTPPPVAKPETTPTDEGLVGRMADYLIRSSPQTSAAEPTSTASALPAAIPSLLKVANAMAAAGSGPAAVRAAATVTASSSSSSSSSSGGTGSGSGSGVQSAMQTGQVLVLNNQQKLPHSILLHGQQYSLVKKDSQVIYVPTARLVQARLQQALAKQQQQQEQQQQQQQQQQQTAPQQQTARVVAQQAGRNTIQYMPASSVTSAASTSTAPATSVSSTTLEQLREFESVLEAVSTRGEATGAGREPPLELDKLVTSDLLGITPDSSPAPISGGGGAPQFVYPPASSSADPAPDDDSSRGSSSSSYNLMGQTAASLPTPTYTADTSPSLPAAVASSSAGVTGSPLVSKPKSKPMSGAQKLKTSVAAQKPKPLVTPTLVKPSPVKQELEDDQTRQRIAAILQQYQQDLACNPTPTPAPRNRKNPPVYTSRGGGDGSGKSKKKSPNKVKVEAAAGGAAGGTSLAVDDDGVKKEATSPMPASSQASASDEYMDHNSVDAGLLSESPAAPVAESPGPPPPPPPPPLPPPPAANAPQPYRTVRVVRLVTSAAHPHQHLLQTLSARPCQQPLIGQPPAALNTLLPPFHTLAGADTPAVSAAQTGWQHQQQPAQVKQEVKREPTSSQQQQQQQSQDQAQPQSQVQQQQPGQLMDDKPTEEQLLTATIKLSERDASCESQQSENSNEDVRIPQASFFTQQLQSCLLTGEELSPQQQQQQQQQQQEQQQQQQQQQQEDEETADTNGDDQLLDGCRPDADATGSGGSEGSGPPTPLLSQSSVHVITGVLSSPGGGGQAATLRGYSSLPQGPAATSEPLDDASPGQLVHSAHVIRAPDVDAIWSELDDSDATSVAEPRTTAAATFSADVAVETLWSHDPTIAVCHKRMSGKPLRTISNRQVVSAGVAGKLAGVLEVTAELHKTDPSLTRAGRQQKRTRRRPAGDRSMAGLTKLTTKLNAKCEREQAVLESGNESESENIELRRQPAVADTARSFQTPSAELDSPPEDVPLSAVKQLLPAPDCKLLLTKPGVSKRKTKRNHKPRVGSKQAGLETGLSKTNPVGQLVNGKAKPATIRTINGADQQTAVSEKVSVPITAMKMRDTGCDTETGSRTALGEPGPDSSPPTTPALVPDSQSPRRLAVCISRLSADQVGTASPEPTGHEGAASSSARRHDTPISPTDGPSTPASPVCRRGTPAGRNGTLSSPFHRQSTISYPRRGQNMAASSAGRHGMPSSPVGAKCATPSPTGVHCNTPLLPVHAKCSASTVSGVKCSVPLQTNKCSSPIVPMRCGEETQPRRGSRQSGDWSGDGAQQPTRRASQRLAAADSTDASARRRGTHPEDAGSPQSSHSARLTRVAEPALLENGDPPTSRVSTRRTAAASSTTAPESRCTPVESPQSPTHSEARHPLRQKSKTPLAASPDSASTHTPKPSRSAPGEAASTAALPRQNGTLTAASPATAAPGTAPTERRGRGRPRKAANAVAGPNNKRRRSERRGTSGSAGQSRSFAHR